MPSRPFRLVLVHFMDAPLFVSASLSFLPPPLTLSLLLSFYLSVSLCLSLSLSVSASAVTRGISEGPCQVSRGPSERDGESERERGRAREQSCCFVERVDGKVQAAMAADPASYRTSGGPLRSRRCFTSWRQYTCFLSRRSVGNGECPAKREWRRERRGARARASSPAEEAAQEEESESRRPGRRRRSRRSRERYQVWGKREPRIR